MEGFFFWEGVTYLTDWGGGECHLPIWLKEEGQFTWPGGSQGGLPLPPKRIADTSGNITFPCNRYVVGSYLMCFGNVPQKSGGGGVIGTLRKFCARKSGNTVLSVGV